jgi:hypothetical protein
MKIQKSILVSVVLVMLSGCTTGSKTRINWTHNTRIIQQAPQPTPKPEPVYIEKPVPVYIEKPVPVYIKPQQIRYEEPTFMDLTGELKNKMKRKIIAAYETL